ncbi:nucleoside-diphosphate kinase [Candidatus Micrarchaeota archaeon]|nr:nucleoside-diphosphate kinase [Candidatus Micrarchaeota archaeon]
MEKTLVLLKPDCVSRSLVGEVVKRIEATGLKIIGCKMIRLDGKILAEHYAHLSDKPFFPRITEFMKSTPVVALVFEGEDAVQKLRDECGVTDSTKAEKGTIRGDLGKDIQENLVHASDSVEAAQIEIRRFFKNSEIFEYEKRK